MWRGWEAGKYEGGGGRYGREGMVQGGRHWRDVREAWRGKAERAETGWEGQERYACQGKVQRGWCGGWGWGEMREGGVW